MFWKKQTIYFSPSNTSEYVFGYIYIHVKQNCLVFNSCLNKNDYRLTGLTD